MNNLVSWASTRVPSSKSLYWALSTNMNFHKVNDGTYPPQPGAYVDGNCYDTGE